MALTNSFPTGLPAGLSIVDTRRVIGSLIVCDTSGNPRLGVLPRNTSPIVTATASLNYAVAGADFVTSRTGAGAELVSNDGTTNVATTAAPASNARTDVIWVRPQFTASADASNTPVFGVTQGVTSGTVPPPEPAIPAGALKLATAYFPSGATATNSSGVVITQVAQYTAASGGIVLFRTVAQMLAWTTAADRQRASVFGDSATSNGDYVSTSGAWSKADQGSIVTSVDGAAGEANVGAGSTVTVSSNTLPMPTAQQVKVFFQLQIWCAAATATAGYIRITVDNVEVRKRRWTNQSRAGWLFPAMEFDFPVTAGNRQINCQVMSDSGSGQTVQIINGYTEVVS